MPGHEFFRNLGLFVRANFLDPELCLRIIEQMRQAESRKALIEGGNPDREILDESKRKVLMSVHLSKSTKVLIRDQIMALKPSVEEHFGVSLEDIEKPAFLRYGEGAFYTPHLDTHSGASTGMAKRRISVVTFLNASSAEPAANCYGGGSLTFYGLLKGQEWEKCAFGLEAESGLLIAFRPDILHEVRPITFGERFTIVSWFTS